MAEHNDLGKWGEDEAALYLEDEGYTIIDRDWRLGRRDLDILAYTPVFEIGRASCRERV